MSKCPKCKTEIDYLKNYQSGEKAFYFDGDEYDELGFYPDDRVNDYECPECNEVLFTSEEDAREFLKPTNQKTGRKKTKKH